MSEEHPVSVVKVILERHENADALSVVHVGGYEVVVRTEDWSNGDLGAYVPPDSLVPLSSPVFSWLDRGKGRTHERITAKRLRGRWSEGLLVPAPAGLGVGDDAQVELGVLHYDPPAKGTSAAPGTQGEPSRYSPPGHHPEYRMDHLLKNPFALDGHMVTVTEKIHGVNARYCAPRIGLWVGSHRTWRRNPSSLLRLWQEKLRAVKVFFGLARPINVDKLQQEGDVWWRVLDNCRGIEAMCKDNRDLTIYGEIYGPVMDLEYNGVLEFAAFDIWDGVKWLDIMSFREICRQYRIPTVPILYTGPMPTMAMLRDLADAPSTVAGGKHFREGVVIQSVSNDTVVGRGRKKFKLVGRKYLEMQGREPS